MSKLTPVIMDYINTVQALSIRKIEHLILEKFDTKISRETIRKYKNSLNDPQVVTDKRRVVKNIVTKSTTVPRRKRFELSVDTLKHLLDKNPNHYWHDYVEEQFVGKNGKGGKLRSDFQKLCEFLRDVMN